MATDALNAYCVSESMCVCGWVERRSWYSVVGWGVAPSTRRAGGGEGGERREEEEEKGPMRPIDSGAQTRRGRDNHEWTPDP